MLLRALLPLSVLSLSLGLVACGPKVPRATATRESGQSGLMSDSFAGQNACNPKNALRPFIIEWDATDKSSFESYAASDIVVVRYEGCDMTVLEECRNDSIRGSQGAYKPVEWTSGALEKLDIVNQGELYTKLPLSVATLGARVSGGEKFHMEYYVSGTRNATRDAVYRDDLKGNVGCEGATHFVYGYNLGAFALGSLAELNAGAEASVYGFGAGGSSTRSRKADKQGGDLSKCQSDSAREVDGCKAPIRLTLRPIRDGLDPQKDAMKADDSAASLNAAGVVSMKLEMSDAARSHMETARTKMTARDGKGCLEELDAYDRLEPTRKSTDASSQAVSNYRAQCLMIAGQCDAGKLLLRKAYEVTMLEQWGADVIDNHVQVSASMHCQGKMTPRDELLKAMMTLSLGGYSKKLTVAECSAAYGVVVKHRDKVKPRDEDDHAITSIEHNLGPWATSCFARAGDCKQARSVYDATLSPARFAHVTDPALRAQSQTASFESVALKCKVKPAQ